MSILCNPEAKKAFERLNNSLVTWSQFIALIILVNSEDGSSREVPQKNRHMFRKGKLTAAGALARMGLLDTHQEFIKKYGCSKTIYTLNESGRQFYNYIITGEKGNLFE